MSNLPPDTLPSALLGVFAASQTPYALVDVPNLEFVGVNAAYCAITGRAEDDLLGSSLFAAFPENPGTGTEAPLLESIERVVASGTSEAMPTQRYDVIDTATGEFVERYWNVTNAPIFGDDGSVAFVLIHPEEVDPSDGGRPGEAAGSPPFPGVALGPDAASRVTIERLYKVNSLSAALIDALDVDAVANAVFEDGVGLLGADACYLAAGRAGAVELAQWDGTGPRPAAPKWRRMRATPGRDPLSDVLTIGVPVYFESRDRALSVYPALERQVSDDDFHAMACIPLLDEEHPVGAVAFLYRSPTAFDSVVRLSMHTIATLAGKALVAATRAAERSVTLEALEEAVLAPQLDDVAGLATDGVYSQATEAVSAGGDWYDVLGLDDHRTLLVIGDVTDHGPAAVGEMARARATVQTLALDGYDCGEIATRSSRVLERVAPTIGTAVIAIYDGRDRSLEWTTAGHPYPLFKPFAGPAEYLEETHGPPLASMPAHDYGASRRTLAPGDMVVFYTDGLIEHPGEPIDTGFDRLRAAADALVAGDDPAQRLFQALHPGGHHLDDVALLVVASTGGRSADQRTEDDG